MNEAHGDLWDYHNAGYWIGITTNGFVKTNGAAVMGRGIAKQASDQFPDLAMELGAYLTAFGNIAMVFPDKRLLTIPVKHKWDEKADLTLIEESCTSVAVFSHKYPDLKIAIPRPGCGNGQLSWDVVRPLIKPILGKQFTVVERNLT